MRRNTCRVLCSEPDEKTKVARTRHFLSPDQAPGATDRASLREDCKAWYHSSVNCSNCASPMTDWSLGSRMGAEVTVEVCPPCQAFWFDQHKNLQLSPGSTLKLMKYIGEHSSSTKPALAAKLLCPRCQAALTLAHDIARNVHFTYWQCPNQHGHFISFFEFLKEKNFIHPLSPTEIQQLRENIHTVNCASRGASIDLQTNSACTYCHSAISILDLKEQQRMLEQLKQAAEPKPVDPALPFQLAMIKEQTSALFPLHDDEWWVDARSGDLLQAGLNAVARWLTFM
jgi:Zn-finger nucleic acid-binding protein